jgi:5'-3' exoribonuclease 1
MGVPKFFGSFIKNAPYPNILLKRIPSNVRSLTLDLPGLLHSCAQQIYAYGEGENPERLKAIQGVEARVLEKEYHIAVTTKILEIVHQVQPKEILIIAVDGKAPAAKIRQQRQRRFRAAMESSGTKRVFDSNCLTAGTDFMIRLDEYLGKWLMLNQIHLPPKVIYSSHRIQGEGEHKAVQMFREGIIPPSNTVPKTKSVFGKEEEGVNVLYGLDADLIMLSLVSPLKNIYLMREDISDIVNIEALKTGLRSYTRINTVLNDFVIMMTLLGNDFLPSVLSFYDMKYSLDLMLEIYKKGKTPLSDEKGRIRWDWFSEFLVEVAKHESYLLNYLANRESKFPNPTMEKAVFVKGQKKNNIGETVDIKKLDVEKFKRDWYSKILGAPEKLPESNVWQRLAEEEGMPVGAFQMNDENFNSMLFNYMLGIQWILIYYTKGPNHISTTYSYPFFYAPLIQELADYSKVLDPKEMEQAKNDPKEVQFLLPHQLVSVLPLKSRMLLPPELRVLMDDDDSPIRDYYPSSFKIDMESAQTSHGGAVLLPNIDPYRVYDAVAPIKIKSKKRNEVYFEEGKLLTVERRPEIAESLAKLKGARQRLTKAKKGPSAPTGNPADKWKKIL